MPHRIIVRHGTCLSVDPTLGELADADVLIEDDRIVAVGPGLEVQDAEEIDATGMIVMPGFVDTHRHTWQAPFHNIASDCRCFTTCGACTPA